MSTHVLVWDLEAVPDLRGFAAANGHDGKSDDEIRAALGDKFPKHIYSIILHRRFNRPSGERALGSGCAWRVGMLGTDAIGDLRR
jgi:hypothetical protein